MNYKEAMEYIQDLKNAGIVLGLDSMRELLKRLGNPQDDLKFVHIAGTNGKGSVLTFVSSVLQCAGYKVGCYSSPQVFDYKEIWRINSKPITQSGLCKYLEQVKTASDEMVREGLNRPTSFEAETAVAFLYFADKKCDIVVLETGLGGKLDATNIVTNTLAAVFTAISMDHTDKLGKTLAEITVQKAGIIKNGCYVITTAQEPECMKVLSAAAKTAKSRFITADAGRAGKITYGFKKQTFSYDKYKNIAISMAGNYQIENAIVAIEVIRALAKSGFSVKEEDLRKGLLEAVWPGRMQQIGTRPTFIIDGAHNPGAATVFAQSVKTYFPEKRIIYIMGMLRDKDCEKVVELTAKLAEHIITITPPGNNRALGAYELADIAKNYHDSVTASDSMEEAVELAYLLAGRDKETIIFAFGSLSYLGAIAQVVEHRDTIRRDSHGR